MTLSELSEQIKNLLESNPHLKDSVVFVGDELYSTYCMGFTNIHENTFYELELEELETIIEDNDLSKNDYRKAILLQ